MSYRLREIAVALAIIEELDARSVPMLTACLDGAASCLRLAVKTELDWMNAQADKKGAPTANYVPPTPPMVPKPDYTESDAPVVPLSASPHPAYTHPALLAHQRLMEAKPATTDDPAWMIPYNRRGNLDF